MCAASPRMTPPTWATAATYLRSTWVYRVWLDSGHQVHYVQNITDVDDPLFERAQRDGVDWRELGRS